MTDPLQPSPALSAPLATRLRRWLWRVARVILAVYFGIVLFLWGFQRTLLYHPLKAATIERSATGLSDNDVEEVAVTARDGVAIHGWLARTAATGSSPGGASVREAVRNSQTPVVIYFQGNAGNRGTNGDIVGELASYGYHVLYFDHRGFGLNAGHPTEADLLADGRTIWDFATGELGIHPTRLYLFGESLGGGIATGVAQGLCRDGLKPPAGLILGATFSSVRRVAEDLYPFVPVRWMLSDPFLSKDRIAEVTCPVLQFHGTADSIVPFPIGRELHAAIPATSRSGVAKRFVEIPGWDHFGIPASVLQGELSEFIARVQSASAR